MDPKVLFLLGCIPTRIVLVISALKIDMKYYKFFAVILMLISLSFLYLFFTNSRLNAAESGGKTWWYKFRLIHGLLYLAASIYAFKGERISYIPLLMDVILGLVLFSYYRLIN